MTTIETLRLIKGIEYWQARRWERIRRWRTVDMPRSFVHLMLRSEIKLLREQGKRLKELKQSILQ